MTVFTLLPARIEYPGGLYDGLKPFVFRRIRGEEGEIAGWQTNCQYCSSRPHCYRLSQFRV